MKIYHRLLTFVLNFAVNTDGGITTSSIKTSSNRHSLWSCRSRSIIILLLTGVVITLSGCSTVTSTLQVKKTFPDVGRINTNGPKVTLLPVEEMLEDSSDIAAFKADPKYLGKGVRASLLLVIFPYYVETAEFHADVPRTDTISSAVLSRLNGQGIQASYLAKGGVEQVNLLPEDHLAISIRLRKLEVDTDFDFLLPFIGVNILMFHDTVAHTVLDCQLLQPGAAAPLWKGTVESKHIGRDLSTVTKLAVSSAIDQCMTNSGLQDTRARLSNQRYEKLMASGREQAMAGNSDKALYQYSQAYGTAITPESRFDVIKAMALLIQALQIRPILPEEARKFKVQAESAVQQKKFMDAADLYWEALNVAPWWPEGHFNRALVLGESGNYKIAMREMEHYLQLAPDAPNARAAQDKIYGWDGKGK